MSLCSRTFFHVANIFWANFFKTRLCVFACGAHIAIVLSLPLASTQGWGTYVQALFGRSIRGLWTMDDMVGNGMWYMNGKQVKSACNVKFSTLDSLPHFIFLVFSFLLPTLWLSPPPSRPRFFFIAGRRMLAED